MRAFTTAANIGALVDFLLVWICHAPNLQPTDTHPDNACVRAGANHQVNSCLGHVFRPNVSTGIAVIAHVPRGEAHLDHRLRSKGFRKFNRPRNVARTGTCSHFSTVLKVLKIKRSLIYPNSM